MEPSFSRGGSNQSNLKHTYFLTATFTIIFVKALNLIFGLVGDGLGTFIFLVWNLTDLTLEVLPFDLRKAGANGTLGDKAVGGKSGKSS